MIPSLWGLHPMAESAEQPDPDGPRGRGPSQESANCWPILLGRDGGLAVRKGFSAESMANGQSKPRLAVIREWQNTGAAIDVKDKPTGPDRDKLMVGDKVEMNCVTASGTGGTERWNPVGAPLGRHTHTG